MNTSRLPFELLVGWRYTRAGRAARRNRFISFISSVSMVGIALGVAALIIVLSVMNGFQKEVRDRMLGVLSHIEVLAYTGAAIDNPTGVQNKLALQAQVVASAPFVLSHVLLAQGEDMRGAWAGEIGLTQFLPKEYFESAVDFDGDGHRNLVKSLPDAMASSAALLVKHGWIANQPYIEEVTVPKDMPWDQADIDIKHPRSQWAKWGVKGAHGKLKADGFPASLLLPMGKDGPAFLAYENFTKAYLLWNESLVYSTTAAYLATRIVGADKIDPGRAKVNPLTYEQIKELQNILVSKGHDVGEVDGKLGRASRTAVRAEQIKMGWPADAYPTVEFLDALKRS
jgi:hypothetical protein